MVSYAFLDQSWRTHAGRCSQLTMRVAGAWHTALLSDVPTGYDLCWLKVHTHDPFLAPFTLQFSSCANKGHHHVPPGPLDGSAAPFCDHAVWCFHIPFATPAAAGLSSGCAKRFLCTAIHDESVTILGPLLSHLPWQARWHSLAAGSGLSFPGLATELPAGARHCLLWCHLSEQGLLSVICLRLPCPFRGRRGCFRRHRCVLCRNVPACCNTPGMPVLILLAFFGASCGGISYANWKTIPAWFSCFL